VSNPSCPPAWRRLGVAALVLVACPWPLAAQAPTQTVRGTVFDRDARVPLPGANVVVLDTDPLLGGTTDVEGRFVLARVPVGRQALRVSFVGYEPVVLPEVLVGTGREVVLEVGLRERVVEGEEVIVRPAAQDGRPLNDMAAVSARSFSVEETRRYAGAVDDPARLASAFAGVSTTGGVQENALVVRGNAPKGVLWRLEGVEIPNPNHFAGLSVAGGGGLTLFSGQLLADSDFFTSAFPAEYGNALSAVFDVRFRAGNPATREHAAQVGLLGVEVASEGPFARGKPSTYLFNYRYSTLGLLMPLLPTEGGVTYQDLAFKLAFPTRRLGRFEAWGLGGLDGQRLVENPDSTTWEYELWDRTRFDLDLGVGAAGLSHHLVLGPGTYLRTTAAATAQHTAWDQQRLDDALVLRPDLALRGTTGRLVLGAALHHKFGPRHVSRTGVTAQRLFYDLDLQAAPEDGRPLEALVREDGSGLLLQAYTQSQLRTPGGLTFDLGVHAQHFTLTGGTALEPRAGVRWAVDDRQALSLGYGLHSQLEDLRLYLLRAGGAQPNRDLGFTRAHHAVAGYERRLGEALRLRLEGYYQHLFDVPVIADGTFSLLNWRQDWTFAAPLVNEGAGRNAGVELTLERPLRDGFYYLLTASLFRARYRGGDGLWRPTRFDQGYALNALVGREFRVGRRGLFGANLRLVAVGGERRSPVDEAASRAREEVVYDEARAFAERAPALGLLDVTLTYRIDRSRYAEVWALQLKNALGTKDTVLDYNFALDAVEEVREGFPLPVLSYKIEF
jgi:hypothetical protein